ncbi:hypothetical protein HMPREF0262_02754 [Clostridium sp. ATCC 29733]|nr:hypothetical protein HMPREF0262_02754 [Clostridium sp. ATCC 29733]
MAHIRRPSLSPLPYLGVPPSVNCKKGRQIRAGAFPPGGHLCYTVKSAGRRGPCPPKTAQME